MSRRMASLRRSERPVGVILVVVVAVLTLAGCSSDDEPAAAPRSTTTTTTEAAPAPTVTTTPETTALDDLLLDDTFPGFERDDEAVGAGPLDLEAAARAEADVDAERSLLETRGFVRGTSRGWNDGEVGVYLAAYEFASADGAAAYLVDGLEHIEARGGQPFDVPGIDGAHGVTTRDGDYTGHSVTFTSGARWFLVTVGGREPADAIDLAMRQAART